MEHSQDRETFVYTYSAEEQAELQRIRKKYLPQDESKMDQLRRLDRLVTRKGSVVSLILGILGALILGTGMSCAMVWAGSWFIPGILIGICGICVIASAYPVYSRITEKQREKIAPEILRLTDELLK